MKNNKGSKKLLNLLIFDMDGVLIDVNSSYRLAIRKTAEFFLKKRLNNKIIGEFKLKSGYNDDYDCTEAILKKFNKKIPTRNIVNKFQEYYLGRNFNGLIKNERLLLNKKIIKKLSEKYILAIFTGRPKKEAAYPLKKHNIRKYFKVIVSADDVNNKKPHPEGILKIIKKLKAKSNLAYYVGDSIDDLLAAKNANINFIGVLPPYSNRMLLRKVLKREGAKTIISDINKVSEAVE